MAEIQSLTPPFLLSPYIMYMNYNPSSQRVDGRSCYSDDKIYLEQLLGISIRRESCTFILLGLTYHYEREDNSSHDQNI
jgi:hypothetical protein